MHFKMISLLFLAIFFLSTQTLAFTTPASSGSVRSHTSLRFSIDEIESRAVAAAEAWDVDVTAFLDEKDSKTVAAALEGRVDVACIRVSGRSEPSSRARFVLTNPELGLDTATAEAEYCAVLRVERAKLGNCDPWANMLADIGVDLNDVGDIVANGGTAYLAVVPSAVKTCVRLLPKVIVGAGVTVSLLDPGITIPEGFDLQDMEFQRLDKRAQKRK